MLKNFEEFSLPSGWMRDPRYVVRIALGVLLLVNLVTAYAVFYPFGGSAEELNGRLQILTETARQKRTQIARAKEALRNWVQ